MVSVFAAFVLDDDSIIKMFGEGLSAAVLLDATTVRMVLVPAVMKLFDKPAWWLPRWLDRLLPDIHIEGERLMRTLDARTNSGPDGDDDPTDPPTRATPANRSASPV